MTKNRQRFLGRAYRRVEAGADGKLHWVPHKAPKAECPPPLDLDAEIRERNWRTRVRTLFSKMQIVRPVQQPRAFSGAEIDRIRSLSQQFCNLLAEQKALKLRLAKVEDEMAQTAESIRRIG